jgi:site-specific recombinase XerD
MVWLNSQRYTPYSRMMRINTLKRFYKWIRTGSVDKSTSYSPEVSWIHLGIKRNEVIKPEILTEEEVKMLIEKANTLRDKAFIAPA